MSDSPSSPGPGRHGSARHDDGALLTPDLSLIHI